MSQVPASQDGLPNTQDITDVESIYSQSQEQPGGGLEKWGRLFPVGIRAKFDGLGKSAIQMDTIDIA